MNEGSIFDSKSLLISPNGKFISRFDSNGNLIVQDKNKNKTIWSTELKDKCQSCYLKLQSDGNLVVFNENEQTVWVSNTMKSNSNGWKLHLTDKGVLHVYDEKNMLKWFSVLQGLYYNAITIFLINFNLLLRS